MFRQSLVQLSTRRAFSATSRQGFASTSKQAAHFKEGVYSNLPFKVHNRKIPFGIVFFGFMGVGLAVPFIASFVQLKKSGNI